MIKKNIYQNIQTGEKIVTDEKLDKKHWKKIREWRTGQINPKKIKTK